MRKLLISLGLIIFIFTAKGQNTDQVFSGRTEIYFSFSRGDAGELKDISSLIYVDHVSPDSVFAYANQQQFQQFIKLNIPFSLQVPPSMLYKNPEMMPKYDRSRIEDWDFYPSYEAYIDMMNQFEINYPNLCELVEIGTLSSGRKILALRITDNIQLHEAEPEFLYTSSIHGDETTGYVLMLRLINYLLENYGSDERVTSLIDNLDLYINPLANPDGTFAAGNQTVYGATRTNANGIDINRNFPDPEDGQHPDGNAWQEETILFMDFAEAHDFVMSANLHGGTEVCNYPWDTWQKRIADDAWWQLVCHEYADTAQAFSPPGYMSSYDDGITNGYDWYTISGGRQDYMNYFHQCREFTLEISSIKTLPAGMLPDYWNYNFRSFLNYMEQTFYGLTGNITDKQSGLPIKAEVFLQDHDMDSTMVFSALDSGDYYRPLMEGNYNVRFSAPGYLPEYAENIDIQNYHSTVLNVELEPASFYADFVAEQTLAEPGSLISFESTAYGEPDAYQWYFEGGDPQISTLENPSDIFYPDTGEFDVRLTVFKDGDSSSLLRQAYIHIADFYLMNSETVESCSGYFLDPGGLDGNYENNQHYIMHFLPMEQGQRMIFIFDAFNLEMNDDCSYDWLRIYDGSSINDELLGTFCGVDIPDTIIAGNASGALTFEFQSDNTETREGWVSRFYCDSNVSVSENQSPENNIYYYPNPVNGNQIYFNSEAGKGPIKIYNTAGKLVMFSENKEMNVLDISQLSAGIYVIQCILPHKVVSSKLIRY